jgi:4-alpha-glucanotransferase
MKTRRSGILLHLTSLPSPFGIGDLGPGAYAFADFLSASGQSLWQVLPLTPTTGVCGNSPYSSPSAFAGNELLISPELLVRDGFLEPSQLDGGWDLEEGRTDYDAASRCKLALIDKAFERFREQGRWQSPFEAFCADNAFWLEDHALYTALKRELDGAPWSAWPSESRDRAPEALAFWKEHLGEQILREKFAQFVFFGQWLSLKAYCNQKSIQIVGDAPIYVSTDSSDVWANRDIFRLDESGQPIHVAGVPPDYFSATGQLWGNPIYDWDALRKQRFSWWILRLGFYMKLFDVIRLDHFRGFVGYWQVPFGEETAVNGEWVEAPAWEFFATLFRRFPFLPLIAEDLGVITPDVREVISHYGFPGMKVLLFGFEGNVADNPYAPHNDVRNSVIYTGTHDNNTARGWYRHNAGEQGRLNLARYLGRPVDECSVACEFVRLALMSVSNIAIIPMQDLLGLCEDARMNVPSVAHGNWEWRLKRQQVTPELAGWLLDTVRLYGRA